MNTTEDLFADPDVVAALREVAAAFARLFLANQQLRAELARSAAVRLRIENGATV